MSGGWNTTPADHVGIFVAGGETAKPVEFLAALQRVLQVRLLNLDHIITFLLLLVDRVIKKYCFPCCQRQFAFEIPGKFHFILCCTSGMSKKQWHCECICM